MEGIEGMKAAIVTGGAIVPEFIEQQLDTNHYEIIIAVDRGCEFFLTSKYVPDYAVGDFDSISEDNFHQLELVKGITIKKHPSEKDETDTELGILTARKLGANEIHIYGATGSRLDHVLGNIHLLQMLLNHNVCGYLIDLNNRIRMIDREATIKRSEQYGDYVSLIPFTPVVEHVTLQGFKYPLKDASLYSGNSLGISNEIIDDTATVSFQNGILLVIESRD